MAGRRSALALVDRTDWQTTLGCGRDDTVDAPRYARQKKVRLHKEWMVRSYLVTLAFVLSALLNKMPFVASQGSLGEVSPGLFWAGWSIPLFVCDIVLSTQRKQ